MRMRTILAAALVLALVVSSPARSDTAAEYQQMLEELRRLRSATTAVEFFNVFEERLTAFIERHPDSPEAVDAHLNLGQLYARVGKSAMVVRHLEKYVSRSARRKPEEVYIAKFILAQSYIELEEFDRAERLFGEIMEAGAGLQERIRQTASMQRDRIPTLRKLVVGNPAIAISAVASDGRNITLDTFKGKVLLLDFWASWCQPCRQEMPVVRKVYKDYHGKGFEILGISLDTSEQKFEGYVRDEGITWPQVFDGKGWNSAVGRLYAVNSIPATFLLDRKGKIRYRNLRGEALSEAVEKLVQER
jgi:thiol-disulfide isomerase/thioredoxin